MRPNTKDIPPMPHLEIQHTDDGSATLFVPELDEHYHSVKGAYTESLHIYRDCTYLYAAEHSAEGPLRLLEVGFGTGLNAAVTAMAAMAERPVHYITLEKYPVEPRLVEGLGYEALVDAPLFAAIHTAPWEQPTAITPHFTLEKRCCDLLTAPLPHDIDIVYFDANGGVGEAIEPIKTLGAAILPECPFTAPEGMMFKAWLVGDAEYQPGAMITVAADTEVKAVWTEYVPQIIIKMTDAYSDGWNDATIVVKQGDEEVGRATITNGASATVAFDYDANSEYAFYWEAGRFDSECSFVILVDGVQALVAEPGSCTSYTAEEPLLTLGANWVTTGIEQSEISIQHSAIIYDLQGRRVAQPQKGIYIVGGRKVVIK